MGDFDSLVTRGKLEELLNRNSDTSVPSEDWGPVRSRLEETRWGTPAKARTTWENRLRTLHEKAKAKVSELKSRSSSARQRYGGRSFAVLKRTSQPKLWGGDSTTDEHMRKIYVSGFSVYWKGGKPVLYYNERDARNPQHIVYDPYAGEFIKDLGDLELILNRIFVPAIAAYCIEKGRGRLFDDIEKFGQHKRALLSTGQSSYSHTSHYDSEWDVEDSSTDLSFFKGDKYVSVSIFNPETPGVLGKKGYKMIPPKDVRDSDTMIDASDFSAYRSGPAGPHLSPG